MTSVNKLAEGPCNSSVENNQTLTVKSKELVDENRKSETEEDWKELTKKKYKEYCKANGKPTSSDEESINDENTACFQQDQKVKGLPQSMQKSKESRLHVKRSLEEIRNSNKVAYHSNNHQVEFKQCSGKNCEDCTNHKKITQVEENKVIPKRWPKEIQKIKDSRALLKENVKQYRESNKQAEKKPIPGTIFENNFKHVLAANNKGKYEEDEQLKRALKLSLQKELINNLEFYESDDEVDEDDEALERAINISMREQERKDFSTLPNLDDAENIHICFAKQLSLKEVDDKEMTADDNNQEECSICLESKLLLSFKPCNHRIICGDCADKYVSQLCPFCREYYTTISQH